MKGLLRVACVLVGLLAAASGPAADEFRCFGLLGTTDRALLVFDTTQSVDAVELTAAEMVSALTTINVFGAFTDAG